MSAYGLGLQHGSGQSLEGGLAMPFPGVKLPSCQLQAFSCWPHHSTPLITCIKHDHRKSAKVPVGRSVLFAQARSAARFDCL